MIQKKNMKKIAYKIHVSECRILIRWVLFLIYYYIWNTCPCHVLPPKTVKRCCFSKHFHICLLHLGCWFLFWVTVKVTLCSYCFCNFQKKGPRSKWTIYKHVLDNSKKCLTVGNLEFCLSSSVARQQPTPAYVEVWNIF